MATTELHCSGVMGQPHTFVAKDESVAKKLILDTQYESVTLVSDGSNYHIVASYNYTE